jgi:hypothetical protein
VRLELAAPLGGGAVGKTYAAREVLPRDLFGTGGLPDGVVMPLFLREQQLGFAVFGFGPREGIAYELLREQISAAVASLNIVDGLRAEIHQHHG